MHHVRGTKTFVPLCSISQVWLDRSRVNLDTEADVGHHVQNATISDAIDIVGRHLSLLAGSAILSNLRTAFLVLRGEGVFPVGVIEVKSFERRWKFSGNCLTT